MLKDGTRAVIEKNSYPVLPIFDLLAKTGDIEEKMMYNTFNMGLGMVLAVDPADVDKTMEAIKAAGSTDGTAIRDALYGVNYDGVTGSITFDQTTGDANKDMAYIKKAADGAFEFVKTQSVEG